MPTRFPDARDNYVFVSYLARYEYLRIFAASAALSRVARGGVAWVRTSYVPSYTLGTYLVRGKTHPGEASRGAW